jgi:hypothetical protein
MRLLAYIGPGAGLVLSSSFLMAAAGVAVALSSLIFWPLRMLWRSVRRRRATTE